MALVKRGKLYWYNVTFKGERLQGSTGCTNERAARTFVKQYIAKLRTRNSSKAVVEEFRTVLAGEPVRIEKAFALFLRQPRKKKLDGANLQAKQAAWEDFAAFLAATHPKTKALHQITPAMAGEYIQRFREEGRFRREVSFKSKVHGEEVITYKKEAQKPSNRTSNAYHIALSEIFEKLGHIAGVEANPFRNIPTLALNTESREAFTPEELKTIESKADPFIYALFIVGANTGLREGDICTLKWSEVDMERGWINRKMLKTGKIVRLPLLPALREWLSGLPRESEYVLPEHAGLYHGNRTGVSQRVKRFLESKGVGISTTKKVEGRSREVSVKDVHSLRHTFCYIAAAAGVPFPIVKSIVGHVDARVTQKYMDHVTDEAKSRTFSALPAIFGRNVQSAAPPAPDSDLLMKLRRRVQTLAEMADVEQLRKAVTILDKPAAAVITKSVAVAPKVPPA